MQAIPRVPITKYIAINATKKANQLLNSKGIYPITYSDLYNHLNNYFKTNPEKASKEFAMIHPDRELILAHPDKVEKVETTEKEKLSNASGMQFSCSEKTISADGVIDNNAGFKFDFKENLPFILVGATFIVGLVVLIKSV